MEKTFPVVLVNWRAEGMPLVDRNVCDDPPCAVDLTPSVALMKGFPHAFRDFPWGGNGRIVLSY
jgi:hypothetical protein